MRDSQANPATASVDAADIDACRETLRGGSRSFFAASLLLPRRVAAPASALYAFCRLADDLVDENGGTADAIAHLRHRLGRAYAGQPLPHPVDRAFAETIERHAIPRALPEALIEGLAWDAEGRRFEDLSGVYAYSARVAGAVGAMMAVIMGARAPDAVARACDLGVAMQLTNICRDVGEDARNGRIYLPLQWVRDAGHDPEAWLRAPIADAAIRGIVQRLLNHADELYARAVSGIAQLPAGCRPGVHAARMLYAEIGREVERGGLDPLSRRAVVPMRRKLRLVAAAMAASVARRGDAALPPLEETRFLVEAVTPAPETRAPSFGEQIVWVIDLFARLEERERLARARS
jgi:15-cis-phytoene synthase